MSATTKTPPIPLVVPGTDKVAAWACATCHHGHTIERFALNCCAPYTCEKCGALHLRRGERHCEECDRQWWRDHMAARLTGAKKVMAADWKGAVHIDNAEDSGWFDSIADLEANTDAEDMPRWVWGCSSESLAFDADNIIEDRIGDLGEYVEDQISAAERVGLQTLLDDWCKKANVNWFEETGTIVVLDPTWLEEGCP